MFDVTLQVVNGDVIPYEKAVELVMMVGISLPGPEGKPMGMLPAGTVRVPLGRDIALHIGKELTEHGEKIVRPSDLEIVTDPAVAAKVAKGPQDDS